MAKVLIVYGTTEGQTAKIAERIGDEARRLGHDVSVRRALDVEGGVIASCDKLIVGASLHKGRYQREVRDFIDEHRDLLGSRPTAFYSVSLAAASRDPKEREEPVRIAKEFTAREGWTPSRIASFAGALKYTRYGWLTRMLMRHIARKEGGDTDTSRDFEYTDWDEVERFAVDFVGSVQNRSSETEPPR